MIYPAGHPVHWRTGAKQRVGAQTGVLSRPWERLGDYPYVIWDDRTTEHLELYECIEPVLAASKNAWDEYKPGKQVRR